MFRATSVLPGAALILLVALAGCTPAAAPVAETDTETVASDLTTAATPAWSVEASIVGQPAAADGVVLAYTTDSDGALTVVAWDAATGDQLWSDAAATGAVTPGVAVHARIVQDGDTNYAVYLRPGDERGWQDLILADLGTGAPVTVADNRVWATSRPGACADGTPDVCFRGWKQSAYEAGDLSYRFAPDRGEIVVDTDTVLPASARLLGDGVYATSVREPDGFEMLGRSGGGERLWERPYTAVFGARTSSDAGWSWYQDDETTLLLGSGSAYDRAARAEPEYTVDATERRIVALDPDSGDTVWSIDGAEFCDTDVRSEELTDGTRTLCVYNAGTYNATATADGSGYDGTATGFDVDLVGVDVATGAIDWTLPLGGAEFERDPEAVRFASFSAEQVMLVGEAPAVVNVLTGDLTEIVADGTYACSLARAPLNLVFPGGESTPFSAGTDYQPCDASGEVTDTFSLGAVRMVGVDTDAGVTVLATPGSLLGFEDSE